MMVPLSFAFATYPLSVLLAFAAGVLIVIGGARPFLRRVDEQEEAYGEILTELFLFNVTPRQLVMLMAGSAAVGGLFFLMMAVHSEAGILGGLLMVAIGATLGWFVPRLAIYFLRRRRRKQLTEQIVDGLVSLANGMRAGLNLVQSMRLLEQHAQPPISQEFGLMVREFEHGTSVDEILRRASRRIKLHEYKLLFAAMETARMRGGNLAETLDRLGDSLRETMRLEEKRRAATAPVRLQAYIMPFVPVAILAVYYLFDPTIVETFVTNAWGLFSLSVAFVLTVVGFLWMHRIASFEI